MIPPADTYFLTILAFVFMLGGTGISFIIILKNMNVSPRGRIMPVMIGSLSVMIIIMFIVPMESEYHDNVKIEIDNASCDELKQLHDEYDSESIRERITDRIVTDCVISDSIPS